MKLLMSEELSALDAALAELDDLEGSEAPAVVEVEAVAVEDADVEEELLEGLEQEIELAEMAQEGYDETPAEEESEITPKKLTKADEELMAKDIEEDEPEEDGKADIEVKKDDKPAKVKTKPKSRASGSIKPSEALKTRLGGIEAIESTLIHSPSDATLSAEKLTELIAERMKNIDSAPKKVGEKLVNAYLHLNGTATLSVYTELVLELILEKGTITSQDIFTKYKDRPYSDGTARSQSGQLMKVLPLMGIAERSGQTLTLIEDSVMAQAFAEKMGIEALPTEA